MRRLFYFFTVLLCTATTSLIFTGGFATADTNSNVSRIQLTSNLMEMGGCEGSASKLLFSFTSTGKGIVDVTAYNGDKKIGQSRERPVRVDSEKTEVTLLINDGYTGDATIVIEAANYAVPEGQKGDQTARQEYYAKNVGIANCAIGAPEPNAVTNSNERAATDSSGDNYINWAIGGIIAAVVVVLLCVIVQSLKKSLKK